MQQYTPKDMRYLKWVTEGARIFSTCAKRKYMALILDSHGFVVGVGYNGVPKDLPHCIDGGCPRFERGSAPGSSYDDCYSIHAETNAIMNSHSRNSIRGGTLYINGEPCFTCAKLISNSGIARIVYTSDPDYVYVQWKTAEEFLREANVETSYIPMEELNSVYVRSPSVASEGSD